MFLIRSSFTAFILSFLSRLLVEVYLSDRITLFGNFFGLELLENRGVAFGINLPTVLQAILIPTVFAFVLFLAYQSREQKFPSIGFGLIIGGALGNIIDRFDDGYVTDFIQVGSFPMFNIADSCITVGVGMLLFYELWLKKKEGVEAD